MRKSKGFSLIETLVVIAVIGILSGIVLVSLRDAQDRARKASAQAEMSQIRNAIMLARESEGNALRYITGDFCSECACRGAGDLSQLPDTHSCIVNMTNFFGKIGLNLRRDPWGSPYLIDENEYEDGCRRDTVNSAGPDRRYGPAGHDLENIAYDNDGPRVIVPLFSCGM